MSLYDVNILGALIDLCDRMADPVSIYQDLWNLCSTLRELHAAVRLIPPEQIYDVYDVALERARQAKMLPEAERKRVIAIVCVISDRILYVIMGLARSPDTDI